MGKPLCASGALLRVEGAQVRHGKFAIEREQFRAVQLRKLFEALFTRPGQPDFHPAPVKPQVAVESEAQKLDRIIKTLAASSVYFDYDNFSIKPQYQDTLQQDADLLRSAPPLSIRVVGNADERGSSEYNLALGQKRAEAVRRALAAFGIADIRMETISYGKEKPRATCHEESCWAQNRRVDFANK